MADLRFSHRAAALVLVLGAACGGGGKGDTVGTASCTMIEGQPPETSCTEIVDAGADLRSQFTALCTPAGTGAATATPGSGCPAGSVARCTYRGPRVMTGLFALPAGVSMHIRVYTPASIPGYQDACAIDGGTWVGPGATVSGSVAGATAPGAQLDLAGPIHLTVTAAANGSYSFANVPYGTYTLTPSLAGYNFQPASRSVTVAGASSAGNDFVWGRAWSGSGGGVWRYHRVIPVAGSSAAAVSDYPVAVDLDSASLVAAGKLQAGGGDLRFSGSDGQELAWWIESGLGTAATRIWVRLGAIPTSGSSVLVHYGNPSATLVGPLAHSATATFAFFDGFDAALASSSWSGNQRWTQPSVQGGVARFSATAPAGSASGRELQTSPSFTGGVAAEFGMTMDAAPTPSWKSAAFIARIGAPSTAYGTPLAKVATGWWSNGVQECAAVNASYLGRMIVDASARTLQLYLGQTLCGTASFPALTAPFVFNLTAEVGGGSITVDLADFRVRPYVNPEPAAGAAGVEQAVY
ncbi:MAG: DUF2341 domain-containing protein [Deltaproteobacteria bacterium]|nr:DUF2341 domain-containing protein [Deltaproteobacteria bacterium]